MTHLVKLYLKGDLRQKGFCFLLEDININSYKVFLTCLLAVNRYYNLVFTSLYDGYLPPAPELIEAYENWRLELQAFEKFKIDLKSSNKPLSKSSINDHVSLRDRVRQSRKDRENQYQEKQRLYENSELNLIVQMNYWLKSSSFQNVVKKLSNILDNSEELGIKLITDDLEVTKLPWTNVNSIKYAKESNKKITITFSPAIPKIAKLSQPVLNKKLNILLIFGNCDSEEIQKQEEELWKSVYGVNLVKVLKSNNTREDIYQEIRDHNHDVIYFSGHSTTKENSGKFYLTELECLEIDDFINAIRKKKELKLVIFNSCDSLGFAFELYKLGLYIPNIIAMRYIIHNQTSLYFLQELIELFINQNKPLHESLELIRDSLEDNKDKYPVGSYLLPVLFQLSSEPQLWKNWFSPLPSAKELVGISAYSFMISLAIILLRLSGILSSFELLAYDYLMRIRPHERSDERILVVVATPEDIKNQKEKSLTKATLSEDTLTKLLSKLNEYEPTVIGLDIARDFPASSELKPYLQQDNVIGGCKKPNPLDSLVKPAPEIENIGFVDFIKDKSDQTVRRHILTSNDKYSDCNVSGSFSLMLVLGYFSQQKPELFNLYEQEQQNRENKNDHACDITLGKAKFKALNFGSTTLQESISKDFNNKFNNKFNKFIIFKNILTPHRGGYHNEDFPGGCQIMLNYRTVDTTITRIADQKTDQFNISIERIAETVTIGQVLKDEISPTQKERLKHRIIMVGIANSQEVNLPDYWKTPYSNDTTAGVFIHTQMVSQILSAALDGRSLISPLFLWQDFILILMSTFITSLIAYIFIKYHGLLAIIIGEVCLGFISYGLLILGLWLPFIPLSLAIMVNPLIIWVGEIDFKNMQKYLIIFPVER